ncbi:MAG: CBS domain-containing protein [Proteobacteria bacterium]|nr:CBS domain-containing protein [Pseudomonadota bacterium]
MEEALPRNGPNLEITDGDVREAMGEIPGYLDITPGDFRELYRVALRHAWRRLRHAVRAKDLMTTPVVAAQFDTPLSEVAEWMAQAGVSGVPVLDALGRPVGMISEADFLSRMADANSPGFMGVIAQCLQGRKCLAVPIRGSTAADIMTSPPVTVEEETPLADVVEQMTRAGVNRVPVVSAGGQVVGIVSRADLIRAHPFGKGMCGP